MVSKRTIDKENPKELVTLWNQLIDKSKLTEKNPKNTTIPIKPPKYLIHCSGGINFHSILRDQQLGGREVLSGNVRGFFEATHFSPIPYLSYLNYDGCIVLDTDEFTPNTFYPTYYADRENEDECLTFNDEGWNKIKKKGNGNPPCSTFFKDEHEWNVENPYKLPLNKITYLIFRDDLISTEYDRERIKNDMINIGMTQKMNLNQLNSFMDKIMTIKYDIKNKKFNEGFFVNKEPINSVAICPSIGRNPMVNAPIHKVLKTMKGCKIIDENGYYET